MGLTPAADAAERDRIGAPNPAAAPDGLTGEEGVDTPDEHEVEESVAAPALGTRFFNLKTLISFVLGFAILLFIFTRVDLNLGEVVARASQANVPLLALAVVSFYATFPIRALRWRQLLRNVGFTRRGGAGVQLPGVVGLAEIILLSWFANCIVPAKLGDAYRAYLLKVNVGVSFSKTFGTILAERMIDVLLLFGMMVAASSLAFGQALPAAIVLLMQVGFGLVATVLVALVLLKNIRPLALRILPARLHRRYRHFEEGTLHSFQSLPVVVGLSLAAWAGEVGRLALVTAALGVTGVAPSVLVFVALTSALATTLPLTPAGLGFAEGAIVGVFLLAAGAGLAPGVDERTAAGIALLDRAISYWSLIVTGFATYLVSKRR